MKINLIGDDDWIIRRAITELKKNPAFVENETHADFNYYLPYLKYKSGSSAIESVALFTHYENVSETDIVNTVKKATNFIKVAKEIDHAISLSKQTANILKIKAQRLSTVINFGTDQNKKITFGVCGRPYLSGRKNEDYIKKLVSYGYNFLSWGSDDWGCKNFSNNYSDIKDFYKKIDYLVIPSSVEGGCVPMLEALALGVPVIAPDVGWCWEYPCYRYQTNNFISLYKIILGLTTPPTWDDFLNQHLLFFNTIYRA